MEDFEWFELKVFFIKIMRFCECCSKSKEIFKRCESQQSVLNAILDASDIIYDSNPESCKNQQGFLNRLADVCFKCDCKNSLVRVLVYDHLEKFERKTIVKSGNLLKLPTRKTKKAP